ncbi:NUDIX domain-containing protein [Rhizobium sp. RU36D]|uniref:NUDIX hydrolase n=1 Tax=Rhizobium sp. RU36D TaxID=1907415 RepID=UPI0009D8E44E|nr:NUDIX domain-containing protein [Rhizobium sp. RU36D]SMD07564.1 ADP-ribose pyrophosphatase YjhB, NUDIX family [Rhizobium sp. RU36D]
MTQTSSVAALSISPRPASSAIVERNGRYLLIRRRNPPAADLYAFPGGRAEPGETPAQTAIRELLEETGLVGTNPRLFATYDLKPETEGRADMHFFLSVFLVDVVGRDEAIADSDAADAGWYSLDEICTLPVPPSVRECAERLASARKSG